MKRFRLCYMVICDGNGEHRNIPVKRDCALTYAAHFEGLKLNNFVCDCLHCTKKYKSPIDLVWASDTFAFREITKLLYKYGKITRKDKLVKVY